MTDRPLHQARRDATRDATRDWICSTGIMPVLRAPTPNAALAIARVLYAAGVDVLEVTTTVPDAASVLRQLRSEFGSKLLLGAGTVTTPDHCDELIDAGAEFIVSPSLHPPVIERTVALGKLMVSGALTPTEVITAWQAGAHLVKVFPCSAMGGASYLRALQGPFPQIPLIPTGGVTLATARHFLEAGALALGVGSDLVNLQAMRDGEPEKIASVARAYLAVLAEWRAHLRTSNSI